MGEERKWKPSTQAHYAAMCVLLFYLEMVYKLMAIPLTDWNQVTNASIAPCSVWSYLTY